MVDFKNILSDMRKRREESRRKRITNRANEIFTVEEYDNQLWFFCNEIGMFPCSMVSCTTENEVIAFLDKMRKIYIETEMDRK